MFLISTLALDEYGVDDSYATAHNPGDGPARHGNAASALGAWPPQSLGEVLGEGVR